MNKVLKKIEVKPLENISFSQLTKRYNEIDILLKENEITPYDINKLIKDKITEENPASVKLNYLRDLTLSRNSQILKKASESKKWEENIKTLQQKLQEEMKQEITYNETEDAFLYLMKEYIHNWLGFWSIIETGKTGNIKNISIFDLEDYNKIKKYVQKKSK